MNARFTWHEKLHGRQDFTQVIRRGDRFQLSGLTLWVYRHAEPATPPRLGLAISRTFGNAVARNRLKRLLREIFRLNKHRLPKGVDLVFAARPMKFKLSYGVLEPAVLELWNKSRLL
jgi:ribonuclease P protein component